MSRQIVIVGGGISGLTALHHLSKKFLGRTDVQLTLLEKEAQAGGTIRSVRVGEALFETGPNGFLDSKSSTLELCLALGLDQELISASNHTKVRYICKGNALYTLPANPIGFLQFPLLRLTEKLRVAQEIFTPKGNDPEETVYEFGVRRLGPAFAQHFLDPMVSGIFGGDARELNLRFSFPRIHDIEQTYGSLMKGMIQLNLEKQKTKKKDSLTAGQPKGQLWSLKNGMGQLVNTLYNKYADHIRYQMEVSAIVPKSGRYEVQTQQQHFMADDVIVSAPAYAAASMVTGLSMDLSLALRQISYASIAVVGFVFKVEQFKTRPNGFGYLRLTDEGQEVLGALLSSNIFAYRVSQDQVLIQVMLGGAKHPQTCQARNEILFAKALTEIRNVLHLQGEPQQQFLKIWPQAIPQYNRNYPQLYKAIKDALLQLPHFYLLANYLDGISVNDCTANAKKLVEQIA